MRDAMKWIVLGGVFLLPFIPLMVTGDLFFSYITGKGFAFRIIVEIVFAAWVLLALYDTQYCPRFSWIFAALATFVGIIFVADIFGAAPAKSFWSNYERMEGWVTLIHLLLYFVAVGSVFNTEAWWNRFFNTSLVAASLVSIVGFLQIAGVIGIAQGGVRIDATLGNAIYMAAYMLFHVFIALLLLAKSKTMGMRVLYGAIALLFMFLLFATGTRGTILGLVVGLFVSALYAALFSKSAPVMRKAGIAGIAVMLIASGVFYTARNTAFVQERPILGRIASIFSLRQALLTRTTIWNMALEGVKEHPVLGWGQSNFDYVFDAHYKPSLYGQEPWFDRVHNIVLDWLIAGGILGFLAYAAIWMAALSALLVTARERFSVAERALPVGLLVGYGVHNLVVFDNLISYLFFITILAFVHMRVAKDMPRIATVASDTKVVTQVAAPVVAAALCLSLYYVNIPSIGAAGDIIDALEAVGAAEERRGAITAAEYNVRLARGLDEFKQALARHSFADQEIREQLALIAGRVYLNSQADEETKRGYAELAAAELETQVAERPGQARMHSFLGILYRTIGESDNALEQFSMVRTLSPEKQGPLFDMGMTYLDRREHDRAKDAFKQAFELAPEYGDARAYYIIAALYAGDDTLVAELSAPPYDALYHESDAILQTYYALKRYDSVLSLLDARIEKQPNDIQLRTGKAAVQHESGDTAGAVATLRQTAADFPAFKPQAEQFIAEIQK